MKIKKEYIILFLIILALVLYIALRKENRIQYELPQVAELAPESISGIKIQGNDKEILLRKEKDKWLIGQDKFVADSYKIEKMINFLEKPLLMTVVSDSNDYIRYGLDDENRITVKAISGENPQRVVEIGYQADVRNCTFIKLENDHRVYQASGDLREIFSTDIDDIRDKTILSFNIDEIDSVHLSKGGKEFIFTKKQLPSEGEESKNTGFQWEEEGGKIIDEPVMHTLLDDLLNIKCSKYIYDAENEELGDPLYVISVKDENAHVLTVFPKKENDFRAVSSDNPTPFALYSWRIDKIIEKFDEMLGISSENPPES